MASKQGPGAEDKNNSRRALTGLFTQQRCITLVRPAEEERDLQVGFIHEICTHPTHPQRLSAVSPSAIRQEFKEGINRLGAVLRNMGPKVVNGGVITGISTPTAYFFLMISAARAGTIVCCAHQRRGSARHGGCLACGFGARGWASAFGGDRTLAHSDEGRDRVCFGKGAAGCLREVLLLTYDSISPSSS